MEPFLKQATGAGDQFRGATLNHNPFDFESSLVPVRKRASLKEESGLRFGIS